MAINKSDLILITGAGGFIGSNLFQSLLQTKNKVIGIDIKLEIKGIKYLDIRDKKSVNKFFLKYKPKYVVHLAAQAIVPDALINPYDAFETNIMGTVNILEAARKTKETKGIIVASSDKAYGKLNKQKYTENDALKGDHPYDASKSSADIISQTYYKTYNLPVVITRFGNVYGEGDLNFSRIVPGIMEAIVKNKKLELRSNGTYVRDYIYVKDVVDGYLLLLKNINKTKGEAFNFGSTETMSVIELIKLYRSCLDHEIPYKILDHDKNEIPYQSLDYSKINKLLGWEPRRKIKETAKKILKYYSNIL